MSMSRAEHREEAYIQRHRLHTCKCEFCKMYTNDCQTLVEADEHCCNNCNLHHPTQMTCDMPECWGKLKLMETEDAAICSQCQTIHIMEEDRFVACPLDEFFLQGIV